MITSIYSLSFLTSIIGLSGWFHLDRQQKSSAIFRIIFALGFLSYLLTTLFMDAELSTKVFVLFRDLLLISGISFSLGYFIKNKLAFVSITSILLGGFYFFGFDFYKNTYQPSTDFSQETLQRKQLKVVPQTDMLNNPAIHYTKNGEMLLLLKEGYQKNILEKVTGKFNLKYEKAFHPKFKTKTRLDDYYLVDVPDNFADKISTIAKLLSQSKYVEWLEGNEKITLTKKFKPLPTKNKSRNFGINDKSQDQLWGFELMEVKKLYNLLAAQKIKPTKKALIAICDTGVEGTHEDLKTNFKSTKSKYDKDVIGHGTHCAGVAAAVTNNKKGIASFAPSSDFVNVTSITVMNSSGVGSQQKIISGIIEAADNKADVISLSLGGISNQSRQKAYNDVVKYANLAGAIVVAAAGNSNANAKHYCPANAKGIIAVSAIDTLGSIASFSNHIANIEMAVAAPGVNIYSTIPGNKYKLFNGTSMATPYVAGLLGLMKSIKPDLTTEEAFRILDKSGMNSNQPLKTGKIIHPPKAIELLLK